MVLLMLEEVVDVEVDSLQSDDLLLLLRQLRPLLLRLVYMERSDPARTSARKPVLYMGFSAMVFSVEVEEVMAIGDDGVLDAGQKNRSERKTTNQRQI